VIHSGQIKVMAVLQISINIISNLFWWIFSAITKLKSNFIWQNL